MDLELIKKLIKLVEKSEVAEFSVQEGDLKIKISKNSKPLLNINSQLQPGLQPVVSQVAIEKSEQVPLKAEPKPAESAGANLHEIHSPIVGTFYRSSSPDADPYVKVGDTVTEGTTLCIVEAMKLMNEIESDIGGKIVKILVDNATPVEYDQPMFLIEKA
ncbi:acetyl-CoA carboxylase biotin carboxyl carrier protein [Bacteroidota bacterium]